MHPNDILYVLTFVLVNPLASAAPIFPNSNDISEDGHFLPEAQGRGPASGFTGPKDRRYLIGTPEGVADGAINDVEGVVNNIFKERDLKGDLNNAIDDANQALENVAVNVDPSFNPPDIPHLPKRDLFGTLEAVVNNGISTVEHAANGLLAGILKERDGADSLHMTLDEIRRMQAAASAPQKRSLDQRDIFGTLEGIFNNGVNAVVEHATTGILGGILKERDGAESLHLTLDEIRRMQAASALQTRSLDRRDIFGTLEGIFNNGVNTVAQAADGLLGGILQGRDLKGDINGAIDDANQAIGTLAGDVDPNFNPPDIPHLPRRDNIGTIDGAANTGIEDVEGIFGKRDIVGDLNSAINTANQDIDNIASNIDPKLNVPDIPNIPTKRGEFPGIATGELPHPSGIFIGHGPVVNEILPN